jgi:hypothetical protein
MSLLYIDLGFRESVPLVPTPGIIINETRSVVVPEPSPSSTLLVNR